ncbi:uracil phosphoribosyltransferase [Candidatus Falkowbacteria bacterium]|nr:uracil phosphoribosyltransferase [Candidatus Falkowbacteria bacterium]
MMDFLICRKLSADKGGPVGITILDHPVAKDAITRLRDRATPPYEFRRQIRRLSYLLAFEATKDLATYKTNVATPLSISPAEFLVRRQALIPVMRAGDGMIETFHCFLPEALIWHMYISRNEETFKPQFSGSNVPERIPSDVNTCFLLDPMLATGGSASCAISHLKEHGAKKIIFVGVIGCPQGAAKLEHEHPDVPVILAAMDDTLNDHAYIVPGLGDAGDRQYPTV